MTSIPKTFNHDPTSKRGQVPRLRIAGVTPKPWPRSNAHLYLSPQEQDSNPKLRDVAEPHQVRWPRAILRARWRLPELLDPIRRRRFISKCTTAGPRATPYLG